LERRRPWWDATASARARAAPQVSMEVETKDGARRDIHVEMDKSELNAFIAKMQTVQADMDAERRAGAAPAADLAMPE
jgi:hypothetical protein